MSITPAKWDAEYAWLRNENGVQAMLADPKVKVEREVRSKTASRIGLPTVLGMALQVLGAIMLGLLAIDGHLLTLLPLVVIVGGEVVFISSFGHRGERSAGDH